MTFKEAVEEMEKREELGFRTVGYQVAFHTPTQRTCQLYCASHGGIIVQDAKTWDEAFAKFDAMIASRTSHPDSGTPPTGQGPTDEGSVPPPAPEAPSSDDEIPL